nr:hypothetical protein [Bacteroidota bacterium]
MIKNLFRIATLTCVLAIFYVGEFNPAKAQSINGQSAEAMTTLYEYAGKVYGTDDNVVNGRKYLPDHYNAKGDPYFLSDIWFESALIINGKKYDNQEILYNIDIEKVILKTTINDSIMVFLVLNNEFIDSFYLGPCHFINAAKHGLGSEFPGFVEQVYSGNFTVLTRHHKSFVSEYTKNTPNGLYSGTKSINYILNHGQIDKLSTKRSLLAYFSEYKKKVKNFMRKNKIRYKQGNYFQLNKLFEYCDEISSN